MTINSLYIFSKRGTCLYYAEWHRPRSTLAEMPDEDRKLMFGLVFSLKQLMNKMNPNPEPTPTGAGAVPPTGPEQGFFRYVCTHYVLHHLETPTGYRIILTSDAAAGDLRPVLWHLYENVFLTHALRNPMYAPGTPVRCTGFAAEVDRYLRSLPAFTAR